MVEGEELIVERWFALGMAGRDVIYGCSYETMRREWRMTFTMEDLQDVRRTLHNGGRGRAKWFSPIQEMMPY
jgi:hypothetical protein